MGENNTVEGFIKQLNFKYKRFGGCDEEDVLIKMKELSNLYRQQMELQKKQLSQWQHRVKELEDQQQKIKKEPKETDTQIAHQHTINNENKTMIETYTYNRQIDNLQYAAEPPKQALIKKAKAETMRDSEQQLQEAQLLRRKYDSMSMDMKNDGLLAIFELNEMINSLTQLKGKVEAFIDIHVPKIREDSND